MAHAPRTAPTTLAALTIDRLQLRVSIGTTVNSRAVAPPAAVVPAGHGGGAGAARRRHRTLPVDLAPAPTAPADGRRQHPVAARDRDPGAADHDHAPVHHRGARPFAPGALRRSVAALRPSAESP